MTKHWIQIYAVSEIVLFSKIVSAVPEGPPAPGGDTGAIVDSSTDARSESSPIVPTPLHCIGPYSEKWALLLSALGTGLSIAVGGGLLLGGLFGDVPGLMWTGAGILSLGGAVAPSLGHFYAKNLLRGALMTVFRTLLIGAAVIPRIAYQTAPPESLNIGLRAYAHAVFVLPLVSVTALAVAIADLMTVRRSVRRANDAYRRKNGIGW